MGLGDGTDHGRGGTSNMEGRKIDSDKHARLVVKLREGRVSSVVKAARGFGKVMRLSLGGRLLEPHMNGDRIDRGFCGSRTEFQRQNARSQ